MAILLLEILIVDEDFKNKKYKLYYDDYMLLLNLVQIINYRQYFYNPYISRYFHIIYFTWNIEIFLICYYFLFYSIFINSD